MNHITLVAKSDGGGVLVLPYYDGVVGRMARVT